MSKIEKKIDRFDRPNRFIPVIDENKVIEMFGLLMSGKNIEELLQFSIQNLTILKSLLEMEEITDFGKLIGDFVENHRQKIKIIFENYSQDNRNLYRLLMLSQPESILIFWLLKKDKFRLLDKWEDFLPYELLEFMANIWGEQLPSS